MAKQYGYARVSTQVQNLEVQVLALQEAGVAEIYQDKATVRITTDKAYRLS